MPGTVALSWRLLVEIQKVKRRLSIYHAERNGVSGSEKEKVDWAKKELGWLLSGGKKYSDADWGASTSERVFHHAIVTERASRS